MDDPDLLYEDLFEDLEDGKAIIKTSLHEMEDQMKSLSNEAEELRLQVHNLQEQNEELSKQNEVLIRNISCLFKTAQMEISRKDKKIRSLQEESLKMNASNRVSPASTASTPAAADRGKPYLTVLASQADHKGKTGETCAPSGGIGKQSLHGGKHGEYATMVSHGASKDKMGETPSFSGGTGKQGRNGEYDAKVSSEDCQGRKGETVFTSDGTWKRGHHTHCDRVAVALQSDRKRGVEETPLPSDGMRWRDHHRNGHRDYATMASQANHKGRMEETPLASGGTEKQSHYEREHCDDAIKKSQVDRNGRMGETALASCDAGKQGHYGKSADLEPQGDCKGRVKESPLESGGTGKLRHHDDKNGDYTAITSRADCKNSERETSLTSSGMEKQDHQKSDHHDYAEKSRSCGKDSEQQDEMWKRRRREGEYVAAGQDYHRKKADERYPLDAKRGVGVVNTYRSSAAHKASESRRDKWSRS